MFVVNLGQGNVFTPVCHSVHGRGGCLPTMHHRSHDQGVYIGGGIRQTPPKIHGILRDTVNKWEVLILLECIVVL